MKALILNSGLGSRMGEITKTHPKCMTEIDTNETIVSRQLKMLASKGIQEVVMTTGPFEESLKDYCTSLKLPINISFVNNPIYDQTNYIYSIYCAREQLDDSIVMMHGDLVFDDAVLTRALISPTSCMTVSSTVPLPEKDFKAVVKDGKIQKVGIEFFDDAMTAQPLYKLQRKDWRVWLESIVQFCENGNTNCYAENALNSVSDRCNITTLDIRDLLCEEIDNVMDLQRVSARIQGRNKGESIGNER